LRQLLGDLFVTRLEVALEIALPILIVGLASGVILYGFIYLGRRIERFEWRLQLENGNRMGAVVREKIGKRDARIRQLTQRIAKDEAQLEWKDKQLLEMMSLGSQMMKVGISQDPEKARRRRA